MGHQQANLNQPQRTRKSAMSKYGRPAHKRASRMLGYALTCGTEVTWWLFAALIGMILTPEERAALAFMALSALDYDDAIIVVDIALDGCSRSEVG